MIDLLLSLNPTFIDVCIGIAGALCAIGIVTVAIYEGLSWLDRTLG